MSQARRRRTHAPSPRASLGASAIGLHQALDRLDEHATELKRIKATPKLTAASVGFASGHLQQSWTLIGLD